MARALLRSLGAGFSRPFQQVHGIRFVSTGGSSGSWRGGQQHGNSHESIEDFENRVFGPRWSKQWNSNPNDYANRSWRGNFGQQHGPGELDDLDDSLTTIFDRMDGELKEAAAHFEYDDDDDDEVDQEDYSFRPDVNFQEEGTYDLKDLDLTKPGVSKPLSRDEFVVTTEEVLRKADFRNVRFLANFITEAGIIIKRSKTGISAKAQRKVAREIKTARAFGLMPFTTMGTKSFAFGKTMEALERDYEYDAMDERADENPRDLYH